VISVIRQMKSAGKAVVGMKILAQGDLRDHRDDALRYALKLGLLDAFTIGAESKAEQEDLLTRIASA
jgi:1-deoxyxylulose-5-phosphate synthase